jgi:dTDP-4-dehydrorhamnose reductase
VFSVKILITGGAGQVGRALLATAPTEAEVTAYKHAELDVTDKESVTRAVQRDAPEVIVNTAAYTAVDRAEQDRDAAHRVNALGPRLLASAAHRVGARLIHISTDFVFDGSASAPYRPDAVTRPLNVYGSTKRAGETGVLETLPGRSVVLRTAWVYAAEGHNFVRTMLRVMRSSGAVRVVADQIGTPTSARSVAGAIWKLVGIPEVAGIHHWTDAGVASWYDLAVAIAEEAAQLGLVPADVRVTPIGTCDYPTAARRPAYSVLDKQSLIELGIIPAHWRKNLRGVLTEIRDG